MQARVVGIGAPWDAPQTEKDGDEKEWSLPQLGEGSFGRLAVRAAVQHGDEVL